MNGVIIKLLLFITLFSVSMLNASVILTDDISKKENFTIKYFYDDKSLLTIEDIEKTKFKNEIPSQFTKGYRYGNAWFKIDIKNESKNENFVLYFTESIWSALDLYTKQDSIWKVEKNGLNIPLNDRDIKDSSPAFNIYINSGETISLYVKGNTIASQIGEFQIYTEKEFFNPSRITISEWYMIYAFILFAFILLNAYNLIATKESIYAYYIGYGFIYIVVSFMHSGVYISFGFANWQEGLHTLGQLTLVTLLLFSIEFLELKRTYPFMEKVFYILSIVAFVFALLLFQNIPYSTVTSNIFFCGTLITIVYVAVSIMRSGFDSAKYYLLALLLYLPSMAMMAMDFNTMLPNTDFTRYSFLGGAFVEIYLFTLILTNRYMHINRLNNLLSAKTDELEETKKQLTIQATTDMLSGLYNRRHFVEISQRCYYKAKRYEKKLSMLMIDIDKFKNINDTYGHMFGDTVIRSTASVIKKTLRESDTAARYGGEEFIILLPETGIDEAYKLAQRLRIRR